MIRITLSLNCKEAGDPVCTHTMTGETEEELLANAKKHGMEVHGYSEENWNEDISKNKDHFRSLTKKYTDLNSFFLIMAILVIVVGHVLIRCEH